ncbi:MAG TPA: hypothetical protein VGS19_17235 [Streptosporangiaceae bacterium]|nr:hypothetical protein [Streptosporangiaceae bacterium]
MAQAAPVGYPGWFNVSGAPIKSFCSWQARVYGFGYYGQEFYVSQSRFTSQEWVKGENLSTGTRGWTVASKLSFS